MISNPMLTALLTLGPSGISAMPVKNVINLMSEFGLASDEIIAASSNFPDDHLVGDLPAQVVLSVGLAGIKNYTQKLKSEAETRKDDVNEVDTFAYGHQQKCRSCGSLGWYAANERLLTENTVTVLCKQCGNTTTSQS